MVRQKQAGSLLTRAVLSETRAFESEERIPVFYTGADSLPRPTALFPAIILAAAFLAGVCLLLARGGGSASFPASSGRAPYYFRTLKVLAALDANHDGVLSAGEIRAAPRVLVSLDANHDGKLDALECSGESSDSSTLDPQFQVRAHFALMRIHPILAALDRDHNGEISAGEIADAPMLLRSLDADDDGRITLNELLPDPLASAAAQFVSVFDADNDHALKAEEWEAASGTHLLEVLRRAAVAHSGMVTDQSLTAGIRFNPATGLRDDDAYREMLAATRRGFAAILERAGTAGDVSK